MLVTFAEMSNRDDRKRPVQERISVAATGAKRARPSLRYWGDCRDISGEIEFEVVIKKRRIPGVG